MALQENRKWNVWTKVNCSVTYYSHPNAKKRAGVGWPQRKLNTAALNFVCYHTMNQQYYDKVMIYNELVLNGEQWLNLTSKDEVLLSVFERKVIQMIFGKYYAWMLNYELI